MEDQDRELERRLLQALGSGSVALMTMAAAALGRTASVSTLKAILPDVPPKIRRRILSGLVAARRTGVADDLLPLLPLSPP